MPSACAARAGRRGRRSHSSSPTRSGTGRSTGRAGPRRRSPGAGRAQRRPDAEQARTVALGVVGVVRLNAGSATCTRGDEPAQAAANASSRVGQSWKRFVRFVISSSRRTGPPAQTMRSRLPAASISPPAFSSVPSAVESMNSTLGEVEHDQRAGRAGGHQQDGRQLRRGGDVELAGDGDQVAGVDGVVFEGVGHVLPTLPDPPIRGREEPAEERGGARGSRPRRAAARRRSPAPAASRRTPTAASSHAAAARPAWSRASAAWLSVPAIRWKPMPERDEREAPAAVGRAVVEQQVHRPGADRDQPGRDREREAAIASIVMRTARRASARPARASRPARWGSSEPWTAWKSCSGARAISSTLKTKPATTASSAVRSVVSTAALSSVCSASMIASTAIAKRPPRATPRSSPRPRSPARSGRAGRARERERDDDQRHERRGGHAERDRCLPLGDPDRDGEREQQPRASPPGTRARRRARTTGGRRASRARSSSRRRRARRRRGSSTAPPSRRTGRPGSGRGARARRRRRRARSRPGSAAACAAGGRARARARGGRRSCARAAARSGGR